MIIMVTNNNQVNLLKFGFGIKPRKLHNLNMIIIVNIKQRLQNNK